MLIMLSGITIEVIAVFWNVYCPMLVRLVPSDIDVIDLQSKAPSPRVIILFGMYTVVIVVYVNEYSPMLMTVGGNITLFNEAQLYRE
jgi:fucose 4-O-acetylase-like acetyltransferase